MIHSVSALRARRFISAADGEAVLAERRGTAGLLCLCYTRTTEDFSDQDETEEEESDSESD